MAQNPPFEIPQQLRELAERNVEQIRTAYAQFMDAMVHASDTWLAALPSNEMTSGFKVVQERATQFAKQNAEACFALASELANAKDIQDVLAIQSRYAQTLMHYKLAICQSAVGSGTPTQSRLASASGL